ncbi:MAG: response regulator transcription factor [Immundisolibacter sp.]
MTVRRLLLIEDNAALLQNLYDYFEGQGYELDSARDGLTGLALASGGDHDLIVLDLNLPRLDGLEVCRRLRDEWGLTTPLLMLTARDAVEQRVEGLRAGADDYLVKPFSLAELEARLEALLRRGQRTVAAVLRCADLMLDVANAHAERGGRRLDLTPTELKLLEALLRASPRLVRRSELEHLLWADQPPNSDALRTHIHGLRQAVDRPFTVPLIETVRGIGYRLTAANGR